MPWRDLDPYQHAARWAVAKTAGRLPGFAVGSALLAALLLWLDTVFPLPQDPSLSQRGWHVAAVVAASCLTAIALTFVLSPLIAPYEQRDVLRRAVRQEDADEGFDVDIEGQGTEVTLRVTNRGPAAEFRARVESVEPAPSDARRQWFIPWDTSREDRALIYRGGKDFLALGSGSVDRRHSDSFIAGSFSFCQLHRGADVPINIEEPDAAFIARPPIRAGFEVERLDPQLTQTYECEIALTHPDEGPSIPRVHLVRQ